MAAVRAEQNFSRRSLRTAKARGAPSIILTEDGDSIPFALAVGRLPGVGKVTEEKLKKP